MTFDEIRNKFFAVADSRTFETIFDYIFNVYNLNMLLQERKYVPPDRAWSYEVKNDTHILIGYTGKVFFIVPSGLRIPLYIDCAVSPKKKNCLFVALMNSNISSLSKS